MFRHFEVKMSNNNANIANVYWSHKSFGMYKHPESTVRKGVKTTNFCNNMVKWWMLFWKYMLVDSDIEMKTNATKFCKDQVRNSFVKSDNY